MSKRHWLRVLPLAALLVTSGITTARAASTDARAAQTTSMFARQDVFCTPSRALPGRNSSNPGVTPSSITITDMSIDSAGLARLGVSQPEYADFFTIFANEINKCGGINGRRINLKKAIYNPVAPDLSGHLQALCIKATEDQKAFVVVGVGPPQGTALQRCISVNHKTMFNGPVNMSSSDFNAAKGRLFSLYGSSDRVAAATVQFLISEGELRGKKVGIIGSATSPTAASEQKAFYNDYLEKKGVNVDAFEILPCQGNVCVQGIGPAVQRMKARGINVLIMTANVSITTVGQFLREVATQGLRAPIYGPQTGALHADSVQNTVVRTAGNDAARYINNLGYYAFNTTEVQGAWRIKAATESRFAKMCNAVVGKAKNQRPYEFGERDINNSRWTGVGNVCTQMREIGRAIESLGANVTTERMVNAIKNQRETDSIYAYRNLPEFSAKKWFTAGNLTPGKGVLTRWTYPCPLPTVQATTACMLPVDRPPRIKTIRGL